jgi:hypothetical protein
MLRGRVIRLTERLVGVILVAAVSSLASAEVYRCTEGGKTVYSDRPCQGGGTATTVAVPPPPNAATPGAIDPQREARLGRIVIGQTPPQVEMAWGSPTSKNIDTTSSGRSEQWVYERADGTAYVYFRSGVVSSYSESKGGANVPRTDSPAAPPPTQAEIEAQVRADKAGERRFLGSGIHQSAVLNRIGEPDSKSLSGIVECWTYNPTRLDAQTATQICFGLDGTVIGIERRVAR